MVNRVIDSNPVTSRVRLVAKSSTVPLRLTTCTSYFKFRFQFHFGHPQPFLLHSTQSSATLNIGRRFPPTPSRERTMLCWRGPHFTSVFLPFIHSFFFSFFLSLNSSTYSLYVYRLIVASDHTQWHTHTLGRTPLDEGSARRQEHFHQHKLL
jgi:hypothetical protein